MHLAVARSIDARADATAELAVETWLSKLRLQCGVIPRSLMWSDRWDNEFGNWLRVLSWPSVPKQMASVFVVLRARPFRRKKCQIADMQPKLVLDLSTTKGQKAELTRVGLCEYLVQKDIAWWLEYNSIKGTTIIFVWRLCMVMFALFEAPGLYFGWKKVSGDISKRIKGGAKHFAIETFYVRPPISAGTAWSAAHLESCNSHHCSSASICAS